MSALLLILAALSQAPMESPALSSATRGITGQVTVLVQAGSLRGRADLDLNSPLLVRVANVRLNEAGGTWYDLQFLGTDPGVFDLRDVLMFEDGSSIDRLPAIFIEIVTNLANDLPRDLALTNPPQLGIRGGYTNWLIAIGVAWIAVPIIVTARRLVRPRAEASIEPHIPTLGEQLEPLVHAAASRPLSVPERGRLELLLYWYWQDRLQLSPSRPEAVATLRHHESAGRLLRSVESWLHDPASPRPSRNDIALLLKPYGHAS
jgi:hypothetical protein